MNNTKEIVLYADNIIDYLKDELLSFANHLGYNSILDINCRTDKNFINFIKKSLHFNEYVKIKSFNENKKWIIIKSSFKHTHSQYNMFEDIAYIYNYHQEFTELMPTY